MGLFSKPKVQQVAATQPQYTPLATPDPGQQVSQSGDASSQQAQSQAKLNDGYEGTLLSGGQGVNETGDTSTKTLLGQ